MPIVHRQGSPRIRAARRGFTLLECLVVILLLGLLFALLLPATRGSGEAVRRAQCSNNLKQIGLSLDMYAQAHGTLPPARSTDADGRTLQSWRALILQGPDAEEVKGIDFHAPWDAPANASARESKVGHYDCPGLGQPSDRTIYFASVGAHSYLDATRGRRIDEIRDGTSRTVAVAEVSKERAIPWMMPADADPAVLLDPGTPDSAPHPGGGNWLLADGSVRYIKAATPPSLRAARITIDGGEPVRDDD